MFNNSIQAVLFYVTFVSAVEQLTCLFQFDTILLFLIQYNDLIKKKQIVAKDKAMIMATIKELDEKKNEALRKAWQQVNKVRL